MLLSTTPRRVKVYRLSGEDWRDNGTGYCTGEVVDGRPRFVVRSEAELAEVILDLALAGLTQFQRQQETLIVWTNEEGSDVALLFQESEGCVDLCDFIVQAFHQYVDTISLVQVVSGVAEDGGVGEVTELIVGPIAYPPDPPDKDNLELVLERVLFGANSKYTRQSVVGFLASNHYVAKLLEVFDTAEANHHLKALHVLADIFKTLVLYNEAGVMEVLIADESMMGVAGVFEYDSELPQYKANHREFLQDETRFKEVVAIREKDAGIRVTIKSTFRLQFLRDVVLARFLDESTLSMINHLVYFNQVQVISFLTALDYFLTELFAMYHAPSAQLGDGIRLLHQFVHIAKLLQPSQKADFFRALVDRGLFAMIQYAFKSPKRMVRVLAAEMVVVIIEHGGHTSDSEDSQADLTLIQMLASLLHTETNYGLRLQAFEALKLLLAPADHIDSDDELMALMLTPSVHRQAFLKRFYAQVAPELFSPLVEGSQPGMLLALCELVSFCTREHDREAARDFFIESKVLVGVARWAGEGGSMTLRLAAVRCIKHLVMLNDDVYTKHIVDEKLLDPVFALMEETKGNNLANSTCLSVVECVRLGLDGRERKENYEALAGYIRAWVEV